MLLLLLALQDVPKYDNWIYDYQAGLKTARESGRPLMVVFR